MQFVRIGGLSVSRFILGGNPFSGFSHQGRDADLAMRRYFTTETIKRTLREAESLGINTFLGRTDAHITRLLFEYWDQGGTIQWFAQTCPEYGPAENSIVRAAHAGAKACHIHGGVMDHLLAQGRIGEVPALLDAIRSHGMLAGVAGHNRKVFEWVRDHLDPDYVLCCYYNPTVRDKRPEHVHGAEEQFLEEDRQSILRIIPTLKQPIIHYKILGAGRNDPAESFDLAARHMRENDTVCVGIYNEHKPDMMTESVDLLLSALDRTGKNTC